MAKILLLCYLKLQLEKLILGQLSGFLHISNMDAYSILPTKSLVKNIGADATGTNFKRKTKKYNVELEIELKQYEFCHDLTINPKIHKQIKRISRPGI